MQSFGECEVIVSYPRITVSEKRSSMTFLNPSCSKIRKITVDGCVITDGPRCDYLLLNCDDTEHYVELKGHDIKRAFNQIEETIKQIGENTNKRKAFIICTRSPLSSPEIQNMQKRLKKQHQASLVVKGMYHEASI